MNGNLTPRIPFSTENESFKVITMPFNSYLTRAIKSGIIRKAQIALDFRSGKKEATIIPLVFKDQPFNLSQRA